MRFMMMHKMTEDMEKGLPPSPEVMEGIGALMGEAAAQKVFLSGEGLKPSSQRFHLSYRNGERTLTEGPFADAKELPAGFALLAVKSRDEALAWLDKFAAVLGDVDIFVGAVVEAWDFGMPKPEGAPQRFLAMHQADSRSESGAPPSPELMAKMGALTSEMTKAGVLQVTGGLASTRHGARIRFSGRKRTVIDGPYTESKELIAGYAIFDLPSKAAAIDWATRFAEVVRVNEIDVREMAG
ncbi:MAG: hypothetical protein HOO96_37510 [Polyangiaceae bacterium]|nr:hypothetical protein [Polyangiaceae bacterium]